MEKILKNNYLKVKNLEQYSRWFLVLSFSFVIWIKIIETASYKIFSLIYLNPALTEFTKIQESTFWFFI